MTSPLTDAELADIRARFEATTHPDWRADTDMGRVIAELDRARAELADARERLASYGSPVLGPVPLPPVDEGQIKQAADRDELERTGITDQAWAVGRGLCPEKNRCPAGLLAVFVLTKRGRLPVHRGDYGPACDGSRQRPSVVLRLADPAAVSAPTT